MPPALECLEGQLFKGHADSSRRILRSGVCSSQIPPHVSTLNLSSLLYWNCLRSTQGDEAKAVDLVRQKYWNQFLRTDLHFFLGTTQQFHFVAPNQWVIVGVLPISHARQQQLL